MLARKYLLALSCINQLGPSYLSFFKLVLLSVLWLYCITCHQPRFTAYCLPVSNNHTKHLRYLTDNEVHPSNTHAKPQIPLAKIYSTHSNKSNESSNEALQKLLTQSEHEAKFRLQPTTNESYITIEINGTEPAEIPHSRNQTLDDLQEPLASSESKPSVVVSHIMVDEDDPLPPMSFLMSDTFNGTLTKPKNLEHVAYSKSAEGTTITDVKNFMKLMRNSTSQWLDRSQALGATTSRRPELSPKSRKFLQEIKSKRKLSSLLGSIVSTSAKPITTNSTSTTRSPGSIIPPPIQNNLTESTSSKYENWIDYDNREERETTASQPKLNNSDATSLDPLEESASTNTGRKAAPFRISIEQQQKSQSGSVSEEKDEGKPVVSESTTTTIEDGRGKKTVFKHGPGTSLGSGDNKLPAKLREKIIEQFLKNGGDPQNIVVSDSTITTTSQSKKKTITTVYKIVPNEPVQPARGAKSHSWKKSIHLTGHEDDEHERDEDIHHVDTPHQHNSIDLSGFMAPKLPVSLKPKNNKHGSGGGKKLKKIMVTRIEVPQKEHEIEQPTKLHDHDDTLGEFYTGPHETIFDHINQDKAKHFIKEPEQDGFSPQSGWPDEEKYDISNYKHHDSKQRSHDNFAHNQAKTEKHINNRHLHPLTITTDDNQDKGAEEHFTRSVAKYNSNQQELGKKRLGKTPQVIKLKKSPSLADTASVNREIEDQQAIMGEGPDARKNQDDAIDGKDTARSQEPRDRRPTQRTQNRNKLESGRARATQEKNQASRLPKSGEDTNKLTNEINQESDGKLASPATTKQPTAVASGRHPSGTSGQSKSQQRSANSLGITTKKPKSRKQKTPLKEAPLDQRDNPSASVPSTRDDSGRQRANDAPSGDSSRRRAQTANASTTSTTTSTTTTTTTSTTTTTPRPRLSATKKAINTKTVSNKRFTSASPVTSRPSTTTTGSPEIPGDDQQVITDRDNNQSGQRSVNNVGAQITQLKSPASISRSQQQVSADAHPASVAPAVEPKFQSATIPLANATVASVSEPSASAPESGAHQQLPQLQPMSKMRNIMMLIDFDAPPATSMENFNGDEQQAFNQQQVAGKGDATRKVKSESQQLQTPFVSNLMSDEDNQWRPLSYPHQWRPQQVSTPTAEVNNSNRQQAPTVSVQIYNNLARDQPQRQEEAPFEQSTISPSDFDFIHQVAGSAQPGGSRQQQQQSSPPLQFMLKPSISTSGTSSSDPFEDFAATATSTRGHDLVNRSSSFGQHYQLHYPPPPRPDAMPFLFASSSQVGQQQGHHPLGQFTGGLQHVAQHSRVVAQPKRQQDKHTVLPDESVQTNRMLMKVIDEIAKSALASGYQVADNQQPETAASGIAHHNYLTPSGGGGDVSRQVEGQEDVNQVGESDYDEDDELISSAGPEEGYHTSAGSLHFPLHMMTGNRFRPSQASQPTAAAATTTTMSLAELLMTDQAINNSRHRMATNYGT